MRTEHDRKQTRKQRRKRKVRKLRQRLEQTTNPADRRRLIAKIRRASPTAPVPEA
jgi:indole-3-glycerol phosphate synthase